MRLTTDQAMALDTLAESVFIARVLAEAVARGYGSPEDAVLEERGQRLFDRARRAGFLSELDIAAYMLCGFRFGDRFDTSTELDFHTWIAAGHLDEATRARQLHAALDRDEPPPDTDAKPRSSA